MGSITKAEKLRSFFLRIRLKAPATSLMLPSTPASISGGGHMVSVIQNNTVPLLEGIDFQIEPQSDGASKILFASPQPLDTPINVFMLSAATH